MRIDSRMTDEALMRLLGERLSGIRLARNLTQQQLAEQAGLGLRTVQRLELGAVATQLSGFLRVCRVLGLVENLEGFIPDVYDGHAACGRRSGHSLTRLHSSARRRRPSVRVHRENALVACQRDRRLGRS